MSIALDQNSLQVAPVTAHLLPDEGPKAIPFILDFSKTDTYTLDLSLVQSRAYISMVQTLYIDAKDMSAAEMVVTFNTTNQRLIANKSTQGYYNVLASNPVQVSFVNTSGSDRVVVYVINVAIPGVVWSV